MGRGVAERGGANGVDLYSCQGYSDVCKRKTTENRKKSKLTQNQSPDRAGGEGGGGWLVCRVKNSRATEKLAKNV